jgi:phosphatidylglycerol lysyltransferase
MNFQRLNVLFKKLYFKEILAILFLLIGIYFFRQERHELIAIIPALARSDGRWVMIGILVTVLYILLQTGMYVFSFSSVRSKIPWLLAAELFLKRNFLSVFLPAGGVTALAYMPGNLRKSGIHKKEIHQASGIYAFAGMLSLFIVGLPVIIYTLTQSTHIDHAALGIITISVILATLVFIFYSIRKKGRLHALLTRLFPSLEKKFDEIVSFELSVPGFIKTNLFSVFVEFSGMIHLLIAMLAIGVHPSAEAACIGYIVSVILLASSPFLRGLGAVELSLTYILTLYGYSTAQALEITILYRIFEFWLPLAAGILSFAAKGKNIFFRLAPAVLIFLLGIINILSTLTPPIRQRVSMLRQYIPTDLMHASSLLVLLMGLLLLVTATFLIRGLRNAWVIAVTVSLLSLVMHLTKALDWEESLLAFFVLLVLILTYKQYRLKSNPALVSIGIITALSLFLAVMIFETVGFYFLDVRHFGTDFTWQQSISNAFKSILLLTNENLHPVTRFGNEFILFLKVLSAASWVFFFYTFIRPYIHAGETKSHNLEEAKSLLEEYGSSAVDYFKLDEDKLIFFSNIEEGFISYRIANGFAIVLDEPVCAEENKIALLKEFDTQCRRMGLKQAYYRVDEDSMYYFEALKKNKLMIGQEALMDIQKFSLEGKERKSIRNGLNSLAKKGYTTVEYKAPLSETLIADLQKISDEWLKAYDKKEAVFSQGMFDRKKLQQQDVIVINDDTGKPVAFLNIIPDYTPDGFTYDMIRKTKDAPAGCMDALIISLIEYGRSRGFQWLNMGLVPLSGITEPDSTAERVVKFAYEKIRRFQHYQGLRDFKEKYATAWLNKYLVYENDFDLVQLPAALNKVMLPLKKNN